MLLARAAAGPSAPAEPELIRQALDPQQTIEARSDACRALQLHGGAAAAEALGPLLLDPQLHFMVRYALEAHPDPAAARVLQAALTRTADAKFAIGLLHSLGVRREASAVPAITERLSHRDAAVRGAAMQALGEIGTAAALSALLSGSAAEGDRSAWEEAVLRGAGRRASVDAPAAVAAYRRAAHSTSVATRAAALVGLGRMGALTEQEWEASLQSPERLLREAAVALATTNPGGAFVPDAARWGKIPAEEQAQLIAGWAAQENRAALPVLRVALQAGEPRVGAVAARAVGELGDGESIDPLLALAFSDDEVGEGARAGLARLPGRAVDDKLMASVARSEGQARAWAIEVLTARGHGPLVGQLLDPKKLASAAEVRATAEALRMLARVEDFGLVLAFTLRLPVDQRGAFAAALGHMARRADDAGALLRQCDEALRTAEPATVAAFLPLYAVVQGPEAATALSKWVGHETKAVRTAAVQALGRWESGGSMEVLLQTMETHPDRDLRTVALRATAGILRRRNLFRDPAPVVPWLRRALQAAESVEDKKSLLGVAAIYRGAASRKLVAEFFDDPILGAEAKAIAERMR